LLDFNCDVRGFDPSFFINKKKVLLTHMSGTFKFKRFYSEGVAAEHPDVAGQKEFANRADAEITRRRKERAKKGGPQLPGFVASVKKEEVELGEEKRPYPFKRVEAQTERARKGSVYGRGRDNNSPISDSEMEATRRVNKMSIVSAAETRKKQKADRNEEFELGEKIDVGADVSKTISDFVHSKNKTFKGDSKKQRINRALGAYYGAQKEETEMKDKDPCWKNYKMVGTKKKGSKTVANCVPEEIDYSDAYDYVIETLIECEFVEDVDSAENMFDALSEGFVSVILEEYIEEAKRPKSQTRTANAGKKGYDAKGNPIPKVSTTHVIHDVDDNLADQRSKDAAKIDVMRNNTKTKSLTPGQFAHHKLEPGDKYGFNAFRDAKLFKDTTKPIKPVARIGDSKKRSAKKSVVTARGGSAFGSNKPSTPMDESFAKDLRDRIGVRGIEKPNIHFTGGMSKGSNKGLSGPEKKAKVVAQIVNPDTKKVITTDDHLGNTRAMAAAASAAAPQSKVIAYQSRPATRKPKGKGKVGDIVPSRVGKENKPEDTNIGIRSKPDAPKSTTETQRARKKARKNMGEEMTPYEYWKQYIA
jgi:hypothetical protein